MKMDSKKLSDVIDCEFAYFLAPQNIALSFSIIAVMVFSSVGKSLKTLHTYPAWI